LRSKEECMNPFLAFDLNENYGFHGTTESAIEGIVQNGFRYCLNSRHLFGRGNYFSVSSTYSSDPKFAVPNTKGEKFVFINRVCVGKTKKGDSNLINPDSTFHTAVDHETRPTMWVTFNDHQSYPEYLVVLV
jgi:hypothetical protein